MMSRLSPKYKRLSKYLSYILRHDPESAGLDLDKEGYASLENVLSSLKGGKHSWAREDDIRKLIRESDKTRFQIEGDRIRALYGHSIDIELTGEDEPPEVLFHGTSPNSLDSIMKNGLKPMDRKYVHLSKNREDALEVGKRHHPEPVILEVKAREAFQEGLIFMDRGSVVLTEQIPAKYLAVD